MSGGRTAGPRRHVRRPRFGDPVLIDGARHRLAALVVAPKRGYLVRPADADDASRDRLIPLDEWGALSWSIASQRWEAA